MKTFLLISLSFFAAAACVLGGMSHPVLAQPTFPETQQFQIVRVHNVPPDMMAYWIDPMHQPVPQEYKYYLEGSNSSQEQIEQYIPQIKVFEHSFKGQLVAAIDAQNALMINANQTDFDNDKALIESMDKPIERVNVSTVIAYGDPQVLKTIPTQPFELQNPKPKDASYKVALMTPDANLLVKQLISSGKLKQLNSPGLQTINQFPGRTGPSSTTPIHLKLVREPGFVFPSETIEALEGKKMGLSDNPNIMVIPTINADDTVTISVTTSDDEYLVDYQEPESPYKYPLHFRKTPGSIFLKSLFGGPITLNYTVADNQSILVTGLDRILSNGYDTGHNMILIITARIQRVQQ
jgi:hypothetical protein